MAMKALARLATLRISNQPIDSWVLLLGQLMCYAAGPALLVIAIPGLSRMNPTRVEMVIGILAASGVAISLVVMGMVLAVLAELRRR